MTEFSGINFMTMNPMNRRAGLEGCETTLKVVKQSLECNLRGWRNREAHKRAHNEETNKTVHLIVSHQSYIIMHFMPDVI